MQHSQTLIRHGDIQNWVIARRGMPAFARSAGSAHTQLALSFSSARHRPQPAEPLDDGMSPTSWKAWLAELDRQRLALRVSADKDDFEFVGRDTASAELSARARDFGVSTN